MLRESQTAVVARNEPWSGVVATEPYEAGWATEAVIFLRALSIEGMSACQACVQISPDGIRWVDEGTRLELPQDTETVTFAKVAHFGNWLRIVADLPSGSMMKALVTLHLK